MSLPALITAAVVAIGAASIATSARADAMCDFGADILGSTLEMRAMGVSEDMALSLINQVAAQEARALPYHDGATVIATVATVAALIVPATYDLPHLPGVPLDTVKARMMTAFLTGCEE